MYIHMYVCMYVCMSKYVWKLVLEHLDNMVNSYEARKTQKARSHVMSALALCNLWLQAEAH